MKKPIQLYFTEEELAILQEIADKETRSRKNLCETTLRKMIQEYKLKNK